MSGSGFTFIKNWAEFAADPHAVAVLRLLEAGLKAADPEAAVRRCVRLVDSRLHVCDAEFDLREYEEVVVVGAGKASGAMAKALEGVLGDAISCGFVIVPRDVAARLKLKRIKLWGADHPLPSERGVEGAARIAELLESGHERRLVIALFSGGGSALMPLPAEGITLEEKRRTTELLLRCGASIDEVNAVRKHISRLKGGQLAKLAYPATVAALMLSDVVGDRLDVIASGPTAPDTSTYADALRVLKKYGIHDFVPESVLRHLERGARGELPETPKPGDRIFERVHNFVIASNRTSLRAMADEARSMGLNPLILTSMLEGEARHVGRVVAAVCKEVRLSGEPVRRPAAILAGGETTVTVVGRGRGGRNQELALSAAIAIKGLEGVRIASMGSDGIDGVTDAAGALVSGETCARAESMGLDPEEFLAENNSYEFFKEVGGHIYTGYTGTNVNDFVVCLVA